MIGIDMRAHVVLYEHMLIRILIIFTLVLSPQFVLAHQPFAPVKNPDCMRTPSISTSNYPGFNSIMSNNKLALPAGKSVLAEGQPVYFYARVLDERCVPVEDAKIELWHANPYGKYRYANKAALATPNEIFAGAGRTYSNNLGEFMFLTVYPGPYSYSGRTDSGSRYTIRRAPHFNIRVTHPDFKTFNTNLFFENDGRNYDDQKFKSLRGLEQGRVSMSVEPRSNDFNDGVIAVIDIVIPGQDPWKSY